MSVLKDVCARSGAHLVVDDYGAGHSNLARILDLNPKVVKLDGALIRGIDKDPRRQLMVRHMVALCADLGAKVVAECIETVEELKAVTDQGVHFAQGYVLARPAFPLPDFHFPLPRVPPPAAARNRPMPTAIGKMATTTVAASGAKPGIPIPRPQPPAPVVPKAVPAPSSRPSSKPSAKPSSKPGKLPSKRPSRRPTPPALPVTVPKRPPPLPGTR